MQSETSKQSSGSEPELAAPVIKNPRTLFAEFDAPTKGKEFITALRKEMPIGIYSINAPTKSNGCRVAVQIEASRSDDVAKVVTDLGGKLGTVVVPQNKRSQAPPAPETSSGSEAPKEGEQDVAVATRELKKGSKKAAKAKAKTNGVVPRSTSKETAGKTKCYAEGHGSYIDIKWHNEKWHNGKAVPKR